MINPLSPILSESQLHFVCRCTYKNTFSRYVHVLVQKMAVNVDLGFILSLVDFFSLDEEDLQLEVSLLNYWNLCGTRFCDSNKL